jgi:DNA polymerase-3 subunit delta
MMAQWRVVLLRETQALSSSPRARELLVKVATDPPPGLALVLLCTVPPKSAARFYRDLEGAARSLEFQAPEPHDLPGWLMERCRGSFGRELEEDAARALSQAIGADLSILVRELEKLSTLVEEGERITRAVVERAGTKLPRQDRWRWFDLVGIRDFERAALGLPILLEHGETGVGLVSGLGTHLLRVGLVLEGGASALTSALPPNQRWIARRIAEQARAWTREELQTAIRGLLRLDELLKSSRIPAIQLLEGWLLERMVQKEVAA